MLAYKISWIIVCLQYLKVTLLYVYSIYDVYLYVYSSVYLQQFTSRGIITCLEDTTSMLVTCVWYLWVCLQSLGLVFVAVGAICLVGESMLKPFYETALQTLQSQLESGNFGTIDTSSFDISKLIGGLGYFFIGLGIFLCVITILGCCGACCKVKNMLIVYAIIVIVILVGELIFLGILYGSPDTVRNYSLLFIRNSIFISR